MYFTKNIKYKIVKVNKKLFLKIIKKCKFIFDKIII